MNLKLIPVFILLCYNACIKTPDKYFDSSASSDSLYLKIKNTDSIAFFWDASRNYFDTVQSYEVSYHTRSDTTWKLLKSNIPVSDSPSTVIYRRDILSNDSVFFFGVRSVTMEGVKSDMHSCEDLTAKPPKWVLFWRIND